MQYRRRYSMQNCCSRQTAGIEAHTAGERRHTGLHVSVLYKHTGQGMRACTYVPPLTDLETEKLDGEFTKLGHLRPKWELGYIHSDCGDQPTHAGSWICGVLPLYLYLALNPLSRYTTGFDSPKIRARSGLL